MSSSVIQEEGDEPMKNQFKVVRAFTHNIVFAQLDKYDYILIGKGIGFDAKSKSIIDESSVTSFYRIQDLDKMSQYEKIVMNTDDQVLLVTEAAIAYAEKTLNYKFDESIHISLLDHINFAIYRYHNRVKMSNFFTEEYYLMYSELYDISKHMVEMINEELDVELPHSEVGSVILHLHAAMHQGKVSNSAFYAQVITASVAFINDRIPEEYTQNSVGKARLITHLKFAFKRSEDNVTLTNPLIDILRERYCEAYKISEDLALMLDQEFNIQLPESEIGYIALHIYNLQHS